MIGKYILFIALVLFSMSTLSAPVNGDVRETGDGIEVWQAEVGWVSPGQFFTIELKHLDGPTYGTVSNYPAYDSVQEWETLIDRLADGRTCPMVFFHDRWRRLPDVLALDDRLRNYGGCKDVFRL